MTVVSASIVCALSLITWLSAVVGCPAITRGCLCDYQQVANSTDRLQYITCDDLGKLNQVPSFDISYSDTEQLIITGNTTILRLQDQAFANLKVHQLILRFLGINDVGHLTFGGLETMLTSIDVGNNNIVSWPYDAFVRLTALIRLIIDHNKVTTFDQSAFRGLSNLQILDISYNAITELPYSLFQDLVSLRTLNIKANNLSTFYTNQLSNALYLRSFDISNNQLNMKVDQLSFQTFSVLQNLDLSNNQLGGDLISSVVSELNNLVVLNLSTNLLQSISSDSFTHLSSLRILDLSNNNIETLPARSFDDLISLQFLNLSENGFQAVPVGAFQNLVNLQEIDMSVNAIQILPSGLFSSNGQLIKVDFTRNSLVYITDDVFVGSRRITVLQLANNNLTSLGAYLNNLPALQHLNVSHNRLQNFSGNVFQRQFDLVRLDLSYNVLVNLPDSLFDNCSKLSVLLLADNHLTSIEVGTFQDLTSLHVLDLSGNQLVTIDAQSVPTASLERLVLNRNPLVCSCHLDWLRRVDALVNRDVTVCCFPGNTCLYFVCNVSNFYCSGDASTPLCPTTAVTSLSDFSLSTAQIHGKWSLETSAQTWGGTVASDVASSTAGNSVPISDDDTLSRKDLIVICVVVTAVLTAGLVSLIAVLICVFTVCRHSSTALNVGNQTQNGSVFRSRKLSGIGTKTFNDIKVDGVNDTIGNQSVYIQTVANEAELSQQEHVNSPL